MARITFEHLRQVFYFFSVSSIILATAGTVALISGLDMPVVLVGRSVFQTTVPVTTAMNGTYSQQIQVVDGGYYEVNVHPDPSKNFFEVNEAYLSVSLFGQPIDETYASYISISKYLFVAYDLKPRAYYVVATFNLTDDSLEHGLWLNVYHSSRVPYYCQTPALAAFIVSFAFAVVCGTCWATIRLRSPGVKLGLSGGSIVVFIAALVTFISTALPWYAYSFQGHPVTTYSLQTLINYGLTFPFEPAIGKASFMLISYTLLIIGGFFALLGALGRNLYRGKVPHVVIAVSGILVTLSPATFALGFASLEIPLYGQGGASPYSIVAFLSYGFFSAAIAGLLMLIVAILTPVSANESLPARPNETPA